MHAIAATLVAEALYRGKKFELVDQSGKTWVAIVSKPVASAPDNPNDWPFRVSLFSSVNGKSFNAEDHSYLGSDADETVLSTLNREWMLADWIRVE